MCIFIFCSDISITVSTYNVTANLQDSLIGGTNRSLIFILGFVKRGNVEMLLLLQV